MSIYNNTEILKTEEGKPYLSNIITPIIPFSENDQYVISNSEDRLDMLSFDFYGDKKYWKIISWANPQIDKSTLYVPEGIQIRIPDNPDQILESFYILNKNR